MLNNQICWHNNCSNFITVSILELITFAMNIKKEKLSYLFIFIITFFPVIDISIAKTIPDCEYLASVVEEKQDLPVGILSSISNVEAGRIINDKPKKGWPWTVNHSGEGLYFESKADAIKYVADHLNIGDLNLDVGCMQISLKWHSENFLSLEEAFDPNVNINYAASFLKKLFINHGDWNLAIKYYHSSDPSKNLKYHQKVIAAWHGKEQEDDSIVASPSQLIKANFTLPLPKPDFKSFKKLAVIKDLQSIKKNGAHQKHKKVVNLNNDSKIDSSKSQQRSKFINERWHLVLKFRKEFKNY